MRIAFLTLCLSFLFSLSAFSQLQKKYVQHGDYLLESGNSLGAVIYYRKAMDLDSSSYELNYQIATAYRFTNNYNKALQYYKRCSKLDRGRKLVFSFHYAAEMEKLLGDYHEALKWHRKFVRRFKGDRKTYEYKKSKYELSHIRVVNRIFKDSTSHVLDNEQPVNTATSEFSPYFTSDNTLLFASLRSDSVRGSRVLDTSRYYSRIYESKFSDSWLKGTLHEAVDEVEKVHIANPVYSPKSDYVYYSECDGQGKCKIFRARLNGDVWADFQALPDKINLPGSNNTQPHLARIDGFDILFYSSDKSGGNGKMDIYYCVAFSNGLYGDPVSVGDSVNSPGNDICPFYMEEENAFYFSSDWYYGLGGFDIFRCQNTDSSFLGPENIGTPINSSFNDLYFRHRSEMAVISSNRIGSKTDSYENCCNDLYFFPYKPKSIKSEAELTNLEKIERLLPISLFFNNDQPNPRSTETTTNVLYSASFVNYTQRLSQYEKEYSKGYRGKKREEAMAEIRNFFEYEIIPAYDDLKEAMHFLEMELDSGKKLRLEIKGYASPLSNSDYNKNLTLRRISSVRNEMEHFNMSSLEKYIQSGQLEIVSIPFGEDRASANVSDDLNDKRNAIYSKKASFERRVEIIAIKSLP